MVLALLFNLTWKDTLARPALEICYSFNLSVMSGDSTKRKQADSLRTLEGVLPANMNEIYPKPLTASEVKGYGFNGVVLGEESHERPTLYAIGWGWNSEGRVGNQVDVEVTEPKQIQKSNKLQVIRSAAGSHHSVLLSEDGMLYSFGDGRKEQLGYGNEFTGKPAKGGVCQFFPNKVAPSGILKFGKDLRIRDVQCGGSFSVAREATPEEGSKIVVGFHEMQLALQSLKEKFPECDKLSRCWSSVRQEKCLINQQSEGLILTWGSGSKGQLGLGQYVSIASYPQIVNKLRNVCIVQISAGESHILAVDANARLYSWGSGKSGKLGHGDFIDRHSPEVVKFFDSLNVEFCAAGHSHSGVITTTRAGDRTKQLRRIACFGRGAHGRLGNGTNRNSPYPVLVVNILPSLAEVNYFKLSCGGAHTVALGSKIVPKCLANPFGVQTFVVAWGFGTNGQLGDGLCSDSFTPVKAKIPKSMVIRDISTGRSWTTATSIGGTLYTWGKGLRGQIGQHNNKFSFIPRVVDSAFSIVQVDSGYAHNLGIGVRKKELNEGLVTATAIKHVEDSSYDPLVSSIDLNLKYATSKSSYAFDCCRRNIIDSKSGRQRFVCEDCNISYICSVCRVFCHRGHKVRILGVEESQPRHVITQIDNVHQIETLADTTRSGATKSPLRYRNKSRSLNSSSGLKAKKVIQRRKNLADSSDKENHNGLGKNVATSIDNVSNTPSLNTFYPACRCGLFNTLCKVLPTIPEIGVNEGNRRKFYAACRIQKIARKYVARMQSIKGAKKLEMIRREVCAKYYQSVILDPIWSKFHRTYAQFREYREAAEMRVEDLIMRKFSYYSKMQKCLIGIDSMAFGVRRLLGTASPQIPRVTEGVVNKEIMRPSYAFTWRSIRQHQLKMHPLRRISPFLLCFLTQFVPRCEDGGYREGIPTDLDTLHFYEKYLRDSRSENWKSKMVKQISGQNERKRKATELALERLKAQKNMAKNAIAQAAALGKAPAPPKGPPPRWVLRAAANERKLQEKKQIEFLIKEEEKLEDADFNILDPKNVVRSAIYRKRRHSISDPGQLTLRLSATKQNLQARGYYKRRNSLPCKIEKMYCAEVAPLSYMTGIKESLELYNSRKEILEDVYNLFVRAENPDSYEFTLNRNFFTKKIRDCFKSVWLNPRLPLDLRSILKDGFRRRSIGEPERLCSQIDAMMAARINFSNITEMAYVRHDISRRTRSFDLGEETDRTEGISAALEYDYEEPMEYATAVVLKKDSQFILSRMANAGFLGEQMIPPAKWKSKKESRVSNRSASAKLMKKTNTSGRYGLVSNALRISQVEEYEENYGMHPIVWQICYTDDWQTYYYNPDSGESVWDEPNGENVQLLSPYQDEQGSWYWYNNTTQEYTWMDY